MAGDGTVTCTLHMYRSVARERRGPVTSEAHTLLFCLLWSSGSSALSSGALYLSLVVLMMSYVMTELMLFFSSRACSQRCHRRAHVLDVTYHRILDHD
jgi:uncharacterized protein (DUF2062 family)